MHRLRRQRKGRVAWGVSEQEKRNTNVKMVKTVKKRKLIKRKEKKKQRANAEDMKKPRKTCE